MATFSSPFHLLSELVFRHAALLLVFHAALLLSDSTASPVPSRVVLGGRRHQERQQRIHFLYNFGDSLSDTGNLLREEGPGAAGCHLPYGETLGEATGRISDGLLMIDYLAKSLGFPYLPPYLDRSADFSHGANFAVGGATALNRSFFLDRGIDFTFTNSSLGVQLEWFKAHLSSLCASKEDCKEKLGRALFVVGEIGGNDYNYFLWANTSTEEVKALCVPAVVGMILDAAQELIGLGAAHLILPGNLPMGCLPRYLATFGGADGDRLDHNSCLEDFNGLARYHNEQIRLAVAHLRAVHPGVTVHYADLYNAFLGLLSEADAYGFDRDSLFKACCGVGGANNYNQSRRCGAPGVPVCTHPAKFISWDGLHLTQEAYKNMAMLLFGRHFLSGEVSGAATA